MFAAHGTALQLEHARVALLLIAVGIAVFWRAALRLLIAIVVVAVGAGLVVLLGSMQK